MSEYTKRQVPEMIEANEGQRGWLSQGGVSEGSRDNDE